MKKRILGRTGLQVSPIAVGGAAFAYAHKAQGWDPLSEDGRKTVYRTLNDCLDRGINYIDTAPAYGNGYSETLVGEVMKTRRQDCVLASKVWYELDHAGVTASVHESLKRLQTDHIDILQIHGRMYTPEEVQHIVTGGPLDALLELREAGKIGHIGITTEEPWSVMPFLAHEAIEVYQIAYNFIYQAAARHFLIEAAKVNAGVVSMRTMTSGVLQREAAILAPQISPEDLYELALKFVLSDSRVHAGIVGMRWPKEVAQNAALAESWEPPVDFATMPRLTVEVYKAEDADAAGKPAAFPA
ncbi:aldo/keto reductase [Azohydromonas australica]|uniref:aldo/keto reductase n=1 Tax=Azohydromonas australica TaxID=364039 RepID=UPI0003FD19BF|nr:aldo/keto reductase [Azohydromonas australica]